METIKNITFAMLYGILDSIKGIKLLFQIDEEMNKIDAKEEETKQRRNAARERRAYRRTPSPTPSSAAAMAREELKELLQLKEQTNPNERRLSSMIKRSKNTDLQGPKLERKIATKFIKCCGFNIGCTWICMMFFEYGILPALKYLLSLFYGADTTELNMVWEWVRPVSNATFQIGWIGPICALCRVLSLLWFSDIADAAYRVRRESPQTMPNVTKYYADFLFGLIVQWLFLFQSWIVNYIPIPYIGVVLSNFHLCLLHALCSFEYKWFNMGWELHRRLSYIENNWPYFIGFGLPLTILTNLSESFILNGCAFCVFFPLFILSGYEAIPIVDSVNFPVRLFTPIIFCTNLIFNRFKPPRLSAVKLAQQKKHLIIQKKKNSNSINCCNKKWKMPIWVAAAVVKQNIKEMRNHISHSVRNQHATLIHHRQARSNIDTNNRQLSLEYRRQHVNLWAKFPFHLHWCLGHHLLKVHLYTQHKRFVTGSRAIR
ncbi:unnamed protein product [Ceratitis capitata]|uniref:(Mediterranean fruit fly) hypothetical protein n=1 Tax=Ceratitis capitata TaxID=7213 RepID=A0A811UMJ7_CERCA|nr:unnamed protein product [Ceratitis capitata]